MSSMPILWWSCACWRGRCCWAYTRSLTTPVTDWSCLLGVIAIGFGMGLFLTNSFNVWADTWGNLQQYGSIVGAFNFFNSQGGPIPAVALIVVSLLAAVCGVISCFTGKKEAAK